MAAQNLSARILIPSALMLLLTAATATEQQQQQQQHCCLPPKWHTHMVKTSDKLFTYLQTGAAEHEAGKPLQLDVFVNHRRPRFELRNPAGHSLVFWRGHMWLFDAVTRWPRLMNTVPPGYRPSGGFAPLFFRCFTTQNGFEKVNDTHYRLVEPDESSAGRRLRLKTVTDILVQPTGWGPDSSSSSSSSISPTCLLSSFSVTSSYAKLVPGKGLAIVQDTDAYSASSPGTRGWPDQSLTERARAYRAYYRGLLRSGGIKLSQPHLSLSGMGKPNGGGVGGGRRQKERMVTG